MHAIHLGYDNPIAHSSVRILQRYVASTLILKQLKIATGNVTQGHQKITQFGKPRTISYCLSL